MVALEEKSVPITQFEEKGSAVCASAVRREVGFCSSTVSKSHIFQQSSEASSHRKGGRSARLGLPFHPEAVRGSLEVQRLMQKGTQYMQHFEKISGDGRG